MKRSLLWTAATLVCIGLFPAASAWAQAAPLTWNSYVWQSDSYNSSRPGISDALARFTPATRIRVTRIEVHAGGGSQRNTYVPPFATIPCTNPISFKISDGTQSFTLPLPSASAADMVPGGANPSFADSGKISVVFPAGSTIVLTVLQGDPIKSDGTVSECIAVHANVTVQYVIERGKHGQANPNGENKGQ